MKKIFIALLTILASATSCHQSDGYIGDLFGIWVLDAFEEGGMPLPIDLSIYSWRFQSSVVMITTQLDAHNYRQCTGTWRKDGDWLYMDFTSKFEGVAPPPELYLTANSVLKFKILELNRKRMVLCLQYQEEDVMEGPIYSLRKLN